MITRVKLVNWRSHLNSEFKFERGTNGLVGKIGSGKTSLLDGICFGLFGTFPLLQSKKLKLDDVIMNKPFRKDRAEVCVEFCINDKIYSVVRRIERGKGTTFAEIRENGNVIEGPSSSRVTEMVEKILKVSYELFTKAIYSEQNYLDYFLTIPRGERKKKIDQLLMIDKFEKVRANCVSVRNKLIDRKVGAESLLSQFDVEKLKGDFEKIQKAITELEERKKSLAKKLEEARSERANAEEELTKTKKIKDELIDLEKKISGFIKAVNELEDSLKRLGEIKTEELPTFEKMFKEIGKEIEKLENDQISKTKAYEKCYESLLELKSKAERIKREEIEEGEKELSEKLRKRREMEEIKKVVGEAPDKTLEEKQKLKEKLIAEIEFTKLQLSELKEQIDKLSEPIGKCPICERELSEELRDSLIKQKEKKLKELNGKLNKVSREKELTEKEIKELKGYVEILNKMMEDIKDLNEIKKRVEEAKKDLSKLNEEVETFSKQLDGIKNELRTIEEKIKETSKVKSEVEMKISKIKEFQNILKRLDELKAQKNIFERKAENLRKMLEEKKLEKLEERVKDLLLQEKEIESSLTSIEQIRNERLLRKNELEEKLRIIEKERKNVEKLDKIIKQLKIFEKALEKTQVELRRDFISAVNYAMSRIWQDLYPYEDFISIKLEVEGGDYVLKLQERSGRWVNVEGIASGGERAISALALRIAFALVLAPQLKWLILDEPTANLDARAIKTFASILRNNLIDLVEQTFIITHQEELAEGITGHLYRFERDKSKDEPTKIKMVF
jgi:exonuclease SbcC